MALNWNDRYQCLMCLAQDPNSHEETCRNYVQRHPASAKAVAASDRLHAIVALDKAVDPPGRPEYQQRVLDELAEVQARYDKLFAFLTGPKTVKLEELDVILLQYQRAVMYEYVDVLKKRIARF